MKKDSYSLEDILVKLLLPAFGSFLASFLPPKGFVIREESPEKKILDKRLTKSLTKRESLTIMYPKERGGKRERMRVFRGIIVAGFLVIGLLIPLRGSVQGTDENEKAVEPPKAPWVDIKSAGKPIEPHIPEKYKDLEEAFNTYWDAIKQRDFKKAYSMESAETKKTMSFDLYDHLHKERPVKIIGVRPLEVRPIKEEKEVMVNASFGFKSGLIDSVNFMKDHWIKEKGKWKHVFEEKKT
ncbi:MAG TPA: hypothetical protein DCP92_10640 [Nitrospiraceae bacterium]|nr:hypothetical protein [Nitrospiraceae bacterium]